MSIVQTKSQELEERMLQFSLGIIELVRKLPRTNENNIMANQLIRSATSIGVNYTEANNAASKQDFRNKIFIAKKEAAETRYWLKLLDRASQNIDVSELLDENSQLLMILQKIISTLKNGK